MSNRRRAHNRHGQRDKQPVIIAGDGIVARNFPDSRYEAKPRVELDAKAPGVHRWIATAAWKIDVDVARTAFDIDSLKFLDAENMLELGIACWDCETLLSEGKADSPCPAGDEWTRRDG